MRRVSKKRMKTLLLERKLSIKLLEKQKGLCAECGGQLGWRSAKHEIIFRSKGGSSIDEDNCELLCGACHSKKHGIKEVQDVET